MSHSEEGERRPRYSTTPLPPYSYVPGLTPHPVSDPRGHMHGRAHETPPPLEPDQWRQSDAYLYGVDLFNHGFYWEAHEAWESLWHAAGRAGLNASWLKSLIKLAAAAVKLREGNVAGAARHARRSTELMREVQSQLPAEQESFCGLRFEQLMQFAVLLEAAPGNVPLIRDGTAQPDLLLPYCLELSAASSSSPAR